MINKYDRFWEANLFAKDEVSGFTLTDVIDKKFGRYGKFTIESADIVLLLSKVENVAPEVHAVTWMNETTFRNYSESNPNKKNNPTDNFDLYDVGPMQINVGLLKANIDRKYISIKGLDLDKIIGTKAPLFTGDPIQNHCCAARLLQRMGQAVIVGQKDGKKFTMFEALTSQSWANLNTEQKNERRVVAYTGPEARPFRLESWKKFGHLFKKFFEVYGS